jgi:hypothetical protein
MRFRNNAGLPHFSREPEQLEQTDEALQIELTRERFGNLVAFRIGRSPKRFGVESVRSGRGLRDAGSKNGNSLIRHQP